MAYQTLQLECIIRQSTMSVLNVRMRASICGNTPIAAVILAVAIILVEVGMAIGCHNWTNALQSTVSSEHDVGRRLHYGYSTTGGVG